jgi:hypothetical protein
VGGQDTKQFCVVLTEDLRSKKITVSEFVKKLGAQLKEKQVPPAEVEKALTAAIAEVKRK